MIYDKISSLFVFGGCFVILKNILYLHKMKMIVGVPYIHMIWFTLWCIFNIFYFYHLNQMQSFYVSIVNAILQLIWAVEYIIYRKINYLTNEKNNSINEEN
jgi:hypothetical protein